MSALINLAIRILEWAADALRRRRGVDRESLKRQIERILTRAAEKSATGTVLVPPIAIGAVLGVSDSELQPPLTELVQEGRIFRDDMTGTGYSIRPMPWSRVRGLHGR